MTPSSSDLNCVHCGAPVPATVADELEALSVDPLVWGNVRETFASFIRDGEIALLVRAGTDEQVEFATNILRQYASIGLDTIPLAAEPALVLRMPVLPGKWAIGAG